ncbi:hypothetical protein DMB44_04185 [Thermoplasma sp. Kam2015]|uniref:hypothetical protein n=1 Tax=Thermoplasma sp. Kam2015 TaxID=2094122 RepID=UPI000D950FF8|nr:hypothetical protein [Thermoplasma sp. Kam2015]PYB68539.1 hypothetical protein DMB44_04185 [Thermoplasma sp. Kam2015]
MRWLSILNIYGSGIATTVAIITLAEKHTVLSIGLTLVAVFLGLQGLLLSKDKELNKENEY